MKTLNPIRALVVLMLLAFASQSVAGIVMVCDAPANEFQESVSTLMGHDAPSHDMMSSMQPKSGHAQVDCPDCDCPLGSCSFIVPSEAISCGPPRPQTLTPDYPEFSELEQVSSLYRPPIIR